MLNEKHWNMLLKTVLDNPEMMVFQVDDRLMVCPEGWYFLYVEENESPLKFPKIQDAGKAQLDIVQNIPSTVCELTGMYKSVRVGRRKELLAEMKSAEGDLFYVQDRIMKLFPAGYYVYFGAGKNKPVYVVDGDGDELSAVLLPVKSE